MPTRLDRMAEQIKEMPSLSPPPELIERYVFTFKGSTGVQTLADLLSTLNLFGVLQDESMLHRHNAALGLLASLGIIKYDQYGGIANMVELTEALLKLCPYQSEGRS